MNTQEPVDLLDRISKLRKTLKSIMILCRCDLSNEICDCAVTMARRAHKALIKDDELEKKGSIVK